MIKMQTLFILGRISPIVLGFWDYRTGLLVYVSSVFLIEQIEL